MIRAALLWLLSALPALAASEDIVAGLSQNRVSITADFDGSEILIYGAVRRTAPTPPGTLHVIITVEGPSTPITVRKKERTAGIWINRESVQISSAPSFYAISTTGHLKDILTETENLRHQITIPRAIRAVGISQQAQNAPDFLEALIRVRKAENRYRLNERSVQFTQATLFRSDVVLPANLTEGLYRVRIFLTRDGQVVDRIERQINVRKEGLERFLFNLSRDQPLIYGLLSLLIAVVAGYGASAMFRLMKR
ncbi:MAG: TIGR02186 family protein [Paracoccaceae bacterium]